MNFRPTLNVKDGNLIIGGITAKDLAKEYGTPLYVMDQTHIEKMCLTYLNALKESGVNGTIAYASKAFCCKEIFRILSRLGLSADSVSGGELYTAKSVGFDCSKLIYHGNNKLYLELNEAVSSGVGLIVIDGLTEIDLLNEIATNKGVIQDVLIRVNPGVEAHTHHYIQTAKIDSKFGFSLQNGDALVAIKKVLSSSNLKFKGLHCHIGSQIFEKKSFVIAVEKMLNYYKDIKDEIGYEPEILDLGGGFGIWYSDGDEKLTYSDYAEFVKLITDTLINTTKDLELKVPYLILEPGRSIVGEAGVTLYTVGEVKEIKGIKNYLSIDGGMFDNPRFALYQAKYSACAPEKMDEKLTKIYSIAGKCCESGDLIAEEIKLPEMKRGELLAVLSTGAYNYSMSSNYNRNCIPPVVFVKEGKSRLVVKRQDYEDVIRNDL